MKLLQTIRAVAEKETIIAILMTLVAMLGGVDGDPVWMNR